MLRHNSVTGEYKLIMTNSVNFISHTDVINICENQPHSSCDVHSGTAVDCAFPLHNPRACRLPAIQPPCGPRAKMILKREILKGLKLTLLSQWVTATTESQLLLETEAKRRDAIAALRSCCVRGFSSEVCPANLPAGLCASSQSSLSEHL